MRKLLNSGKELVLSSISNAKAWKSKRKIVIIESDDWGTIRMPSKNAFDNLINKGIRVDKSFYDSLDSLENREDLTSLLNVVADNTNQSVKPIITFNTVIQNPDFNKIRENNFETFYGENLFDSYKSYYGEDLKSLWQNAINEKLILPQYHAREHLNSHLWMNDLRLGIVDTKLAFDEGFFGLKTKTSSKLRAHYLATYFAESTEEFSYVKEALIDGVKQFESLFGFTSKSFIASNYVWPIELERNLNELDFTLIQGQRKQIATNYLTRSVDHIPHYTGEVNSFGQCYSVRNVLFEPYLDQNKNWADSAFKEVENAFFWNTPAIISSHRINYASNMSMRNRDSSLRYLDSLLKKINTKFPDAIYMSSDELAQLLTGREL